MAELELDIQQTTEETPAAMDGQEEVTAVAEDAKPVEGAVAPPPSPKQKKKKKAKKDRATNRHEEEEAMMRYGIHDLVNADEAALTPKKLRRYFAGPVLVGFIKHNWKFLLLVVGMLVVYIALGYQIRDYIVQNERLSRTLEDRRYKALTRSSELRERTLGSNVAKELADTTLRIPKQQSFMLPVKKMADE